MQAKEIIRKAKEEKRNLLEPEANHILESYGIPVPEYKFASDAEEAVKFSKSIGFPVALKLVSPDIIHKSDSGVVVLNLNSEKEVEDACQKITDNARKFKSDVDIRGILISKMLKKGKEVIIGMTRDAQFGPAIMFGLGGIFVEILKDISFRVAPITGKDATEMIKEISGYPLLEGARGAVPADIKSLVDMIIKVSKLSVELEDISELDLNPVLVYEKGARAVDARIII